MKPLITNKTHMEAFDKFNREYETKALSVCPVLKNITIDAVWKFVQWTEGAIDYVYRTIKEPGKPHELKDGTATQSADTSTQKKDHWIWKVLKILLWVAVIWGILILIYVIPGLGVPAAALAGYVGVKMTKKEEQK